MRKQLLGIGIAAMLVAGAAVVDAGRQTAVSSEPPNHAAAVIRSEQGGSEMKAVLEAVYFDRGELAPAFRSGGLAKLPSGQRNPELIERLIERVMSDHPSFVAEFDDAISGSDPYLLQSALSSGEELVLEAASDVGVSYLTDGSGAGAVTVVVLVDWVIPQVFVTPVTTGGEVVPSGTLIIRSFSENGEISVDEVATVYKALSLLRAAGTPRT